MTWIKALYADLIQGPCEVVSGDNNLFTSIKGYSYH